MAKLIIFSAPSGSGKSTLIRCINQLEQHQQGLVVVLGEELDGNLKGLDQPSAPRNGERWSGVLLSDS